MKIIINNHEYDQVQWIVSNGKGTLIIETENSVVDVISKLGEHNTLEVYNDEDVLTSIWFNSEIIDVHEGFAENGNRAIIADLVVSILNDNSETTLQTGIDESVDGIMELAEYVSGLEEEHIETRRRVDMYTKSVNDVHNDFDNKYNDTNDKFVFTNQQIADLVKSVTKMQNQIVSLQDAVNTVPKNIIMRFDEFANKYNMLADRIADLENK